MPISILHLKIPYNQLVVMKFKGLKLCGLHKGLLNHKEGLAVYDIDMCDYSTIIKMKQLL